MEKTSLSKLTVAALKLNNIFEFPDGVVNTNPTGTDGRLLHTLLQAMGLDYTLTTPVDGEFGNFRNGNWSGVVGMIIREEADIAVPALTFTEERSRVVDYCMPHLRTDLRFVTDLPIKLPRSYTYVYPFDQMTWALVLGLMFVMPLIVRLLFKTHRDFSSLWLKMFAHVIGRSASFNRLELSEKLFMVCWWFGTLIISWSYAAVIASFLSVPLYDSTVDDFRQLAKAVQKGQYKVFMTEKSVYTVLLSQSNEENSEYIYKMLKKNNWYIPLNTMFTDTPLGQHIARISTTFHLQMTFGKEPYTTKHYSNDGLQQFYFGIVISKKLTYLKKSLDKKLLKITEAGLFSKYVDDETYKVWLKFRKSAGEEITHPLSLEEISGALVLLLCGFCLSFIVFIFEMLCYKFKGKSFQLFKIASQYCLNL